MICLICRQSETVTGLTLIVLERGEFRLLVNDVPVHICPSCGEPYVEEDVAVRLLQSAESVSKAGVLEERIEFNRLV